ncbi:MAG: hypothetical protein LBH59_11650 [Planctomycetaceae bacterium]|jgi:hypothetical protein|nr:hypothetical protein [Planctomycetaceae bacterium]
MSKNFIHNIVIAVVSAIVVTSGAIIISRITSNPKSDSTGDVAAIEDGNEESQQPTTDDKSKSKNSRAKEIARLYTGRTLPKEPLPEDDIVHHQDIVTPENTTPTKTTNNPTPNKSSTESILSNIEDLPIMPPIIDDQKTDLTITKSQPTTETTILPPKSNPIEIIQNAKTPIEDVVLPPTSIPKYIESKKAESSTNTNPPANKIIPPPTNPTTSTPPPLPPSYNQNVSTIPAPAIPPISLPPPLWVYDYASGTIGIYYFSPINQQANTTNYQPNPNTPNNANTTTQNTAPNLNNFAVPATQFNPRIVSPFQLLPAPIPLQPAPIYIQPYQPIQVYSNPIYQPQPIIIFR